MYAMGKFEDAYKQLNKAQRDAVDSIEGPVLVIAGPGTGKTQLLATRVANILQSPDAQAEPSNILCLTFTESAAYEMRQRLINLIGQKAYNVSISTYHAFGSELISRFPDYFNSDYDQRPIDELGQYTIIDALIAELPYDNPLKKSGSYIHDVVSAISEYKRALLEPEDLRLIASQNLDFIAAVSSITEETLQGIDRISKKSLTAFETLRDKTTELPMPDSPRDVIALGTLWQNELDAALEAADETGKTNPVTAWKNRWLGRDANAQYIVAGRFTNLKLQAMADLYQSYLDELNRQQVFDYDDMILRAIAGLKNSAELRYTLQEQYRYILLDEFQDTNAAQLEIVKLLSDSPLHEGQPNVLAVGDDDQAIYAFQGADYSHMLEFQKMYKNVNVITLRENYRSHQDILDTAGNVASQIEERLHHTLPGVEKTLSAQSSRLPKKAVLQRNEFKSDLAQYAWVTKQIAQLIKAGTNPKEIAVLAPKHRYLEPIIPYLRQARIAVRYDKREDVLQDPKIMQLLHMAELVDALRRGNQVLCDSLWPEVLSYDFWEISTEQIWNISWAAADAREHWMPHLLAEPTTKIIALFFAQLSNITGIETLETMLDYLVGVKDISLDKNEPTFASPFYSFNFSKERQTTDIQSFWALLSNLTVLRQRLRDYKTEDDDRVSLQDFVDFAHNHQAAKIKVLNTSPYHESSDAVQVMTTYKSKGLEFEHVFMLAAIDEVWGSKVITQTTKVPLPQNLAFVRYQGASNDERLRLLFVAITRAKYGLHMSSYRQNFAGKPTTRLKYFNEVEEVDAIKSMVLPVANQAVMFSDDDAPEVSELAAFWHGRHSEQKSLATLKDILRPRLERYQMAPTHVNSFTDTMYGGPEYFFLNTILRFPKGPIISGEFGNAIHETLEWIHLQQRQHHKLPTEKAILAMFEKKLRDKKLSERDTKQLLKRGTSALKIYLPEKLSEFSEDDEHECNFKNQGIFVGNAHLSGKIDKLIIDKKTRTIKIVDFKTGDSFQKWNSQSVKLHKYRTQLYIYKLLVEGSQRFADYRVTDAYLEFVEPDEHGKINQLHVEFDSDEMQRLKKLINVVWEHILSLNFPSINGYSDDIKGVKNFESDLESGKI